jgi:putative oxidoreductase
MDMRAISVKWSPYLLATLRIVTALLLLEHGTQKLLGFPASANPSLALMSLLGLQGCLELIGSLLLVSGAFTRAAAFVLSGDMAAAYFMAHLPKSIFPVLNGGDAAILFCFIFLYLAVAGGGACAVDNLRRKTDMP